MIKLSDLEIGKTATVKKLETDGITKERLKMLNVSLGAKIRLLKKSFFARTYLLESDGVRLGIRKNIAEKIFVERSAENSEAPGKESRHNRNNIIRTSP